MSHFLCESFFFPAHPPNCYRASFPPAKVILIVLCWCSSTQASLTTPLSSSELSALSWDMVSCKSLSQLHIHLSITWNLILKENFSLLTSTHHASRFSIKYTLLLPYCECPNVTLSLNKFGGSSCSAQGSANHRLCWHFLLTRTNQIHPGSNVHAAIEQLQNEHEAEFFGNDYGEIADRCSMTASV